MTATKNTQRGEGKIGCILTLAVMGAALAFVYKVGPVYYANMELADKADEVGSMGSRVPAEQVDSEMRAKARELEIHEALKPGAIRVTKVITGETGTCTIVLKYTRKIDLYGLTTLEIKQDKVIDKKIYTGF